MPLLTRSPGASARPSQMSVQDADGSGAIDAGELGAALKLLGVRATASEVTAMLDSVGDSDSGEIEYPQFVQIMTDVLTRPPAQALVLSLALCPERIFIRRHGTCTIAISQQQLM